MKQYLDLVKFVLENGEKKDDRTGTGTISVFGYQNRYDMREGFPLVTTKKVYFRGILHELLWFLKGDTNIKYLVDRDVKIWNEWPYETYKASSEFKGETLDEFVAKIKENSGSKAGTDSGSNSGTDSGSNSGSDSGSKAGTDSGSNSGSDSGSKAGTDSGSTADFAQKWGVLGPVYGKQWIRWEGRDGKPINQIQNVIDDIKKNPDSRRLIVSGWNVADIQELITGKKSAPPLCHTLFQFYVSNGNIDMQLYQRSADIALGVPFNIASYSMLLMMIAQECNLTPRYFIHTFGDAHIYSNHIEGLKEQLKRTPHKLPQLKIAKKSIWDLKFEDFELTGYESDGPIKFPIAV